RIRYGEVRMRQDEELRLHPRMNAARDGGRIMVRLPVPRRDRQFSAGSQREVLIDAVQAVDLHVVRDGRGVLADELLADAQDAEVRLELAAGLIDNQLLLRRRDLLQVW